MDELILALKQGKWVILVCVGVLLVLSLVYSLTATPMYRADVVLSPASEDGMRPSLGALGGLANLAGININGGGNKSVEALAILKSKEFAREFIDSQKLADEFLAERSRGWLARLFGGSRSKDPRLAVEYFDGSVRRVSEDRKTGLVTLSMQWREPAQAAAWANLAVKLLNDRMRSRALDESQRNVVYLQQQLGATNVVSLQQAVGRLLEAEMQKVMMARGNDEFAFKIIDVATPPRKQFWPRPVLLAALAMLVGGVLSATFVLIRRT
jgi:uncharacterized protein involved in exopolysaccharide biosynthesis